MNKEEKIYIYKPIVVQILQDLFFSNKKLFKYHNIGIQ